MLLELKDKIFKYEKVLSKFAKIFNSAPCKKKYLYIRPLKISGLTISNARKLGFKTTYFMWKNCEITAPRLKGFYKLHKLFVSIVVPYFLFY